MTYAVEGLCTGQCKHYAVSWSYKNLLHLLNMLFNCRQSRFGPHFGSMIIQPVISEQLTMFQCLNCNGFKGQRLCTHCVVASARHTSTVKGKSGASKFKGQLQLQSKLKANLKYLGRPYLKLQILNAKYKHNRRLDSQFNPGFNLHKCQKLLFKYFKD